MELAHKARQEARAGHRESAVRLLYITHDLSTAKTAFAGINTQLPTHVFAPAKTGLKTVILNDNY